MIRSFKFAAPAAGTSLFDLIGGELDRCSGILLQTPLANANPVYFGEKGREYAYILNGGASGIDLHNLRDVYVKGTAPDQIILIVY